MQESLLFRPVDPRLSVTVREVLSAWNQRCLESERIKPEVYEQWWEVDSGLGILPEGRVTDLTRLQFTGMLSRIKKFVT